MKTLSVRRSNVFVILFFVMFFVTCTRPVQLPGGDSIITHTISKKMNNDNLNVCLKPNRPTMDLLPCFGGEILRRLQDLEERDEFDLINGVSMRRDESGPRDISNYLDKDPMDFRSIVEGASTLLSKRSLQWDMGYLHPGLIMRIGPSLSANGVLEFVMDSRIRDREIIDHEPSTARLLMRQLLVPFLLGFKFQLSTLLPILFGLMVLLSKKALILAKLAVIATSVFGYNSLFGQGHGPGYGYGHGPGYSAYGNRHHGHEYFYKNDAHPHVDENIDPYYASSSNNHGETGYKSGPVNSPEDLRDRLERLFAEKHGRDRVNGARNFAWNE